MERTSGTILVTGATGTVGASVMQLLVEDSAPARAGSRDPAAARSMQPGAEWVAFDMERPGTFASALEGVDRVFLIARPGDDEPERTARPFVEAMRRGDVRHVVTLSAMGADRRDDISLGRLEALVEDSGLAWTHLRPNWFMQIFCVSPLVDAIRATGCIEVPAGDARISWIDARDVAAVSAATLTRPGHAGRAYLLTGAEALDHTEVARTLSEASGRDVRYRTLDEDEGRRAVLASGLGPRRAERLGRFYRLVRAGACAPVSTDVATVLGRPPIGFQRFARAYSHTWLAPSREVAGRA